MKTSKKTTVQVIIKIILFLLFSWLYLSNPLDKKSTSLLLIVVILTGIILLCELLLKFRFKKQEKHLPAIIGLVIGILGYLIF